GAEEVMWPVIVAVSTTVAAFFPLMFVRGRIGDFMKQLPLVVVAALSVSLLEALVVLPAHLRHLPDLRRREQHTPRTWLGKLLHGLSELQHHFMQLLMKSYGGLLKIALRWRYVSFAVAAGCCFMALGLLIGKTPTGYSIGNIVEWQFIQKMDAESMYAQVEMPVGTNAEAVEEKMRVLSDFAGTIPEVKSVSMDVASIMSVGGEGSATANSQSHLGQVWVELLAADERETKGMRGSQEVLADLRTVSESLTGVNSVKWEVMNGGPAGKDIEIRVSGPEFEQVRDVSEEIQQHLATYEGVVDLSDDYDEGKRELRLELKDAARPTGITKAVLGGHVRAATYGAEARRITRNREDVKIMVRYPE
ncbi:MAG: efflux RND transporter permease subunit, partial [Planctomycetaceae bacterium]|nr:efflux RND transporter permease subunit [Planctomycetaceae bacterium]